MTKRYGRGAVVHSVLLSAFAAICLLSQGIAHAADDRIEIVVTNTAGSVTVIHEGKPLDARVGKKISLPASILTGADGALELRQNQTTVTIAANSSLEIPATGLASGKIDRVVQSSGSVFYRVEKRETQKLRVETPYLVAVIKGTQFNVVVQPDNTTVALFEGRLEIISDNGADTVDLNTGEIAIRSTVAPRIRVLRMATGELLRAQASPDAMAPNRGPSNDPNTAPDNGGARVTGAAPTPVARGIAGALPSSNGGTVQNSAVSGASTVSAGTQVDASGANASLGVSGSKVALGVASAVDAGKGAIGVSAQLGTNLGAANTNVNAGTNVNLPNNVAANGGISVGIAGNAATASVGSTANLGSGAAAVNAGVSAGIAGTSTSASLGPSPNLGASTASVNAGATVNLGSNSMGAPSSANSNAAGVSATLTSSTSLGNASTPSVGASATISTPAATVSTGATVSGSQVGANVGVGGLNVGVNATLPTDLLGGSKTSTPSTTTPATTPPATTPPTVTTATPSANPGGNIVGGLKSIFGSR